jgi:hypothetical protein
MSDARKLERDLSHALKSAVHTHRGKTASASGWALLYDASIKERDELANALRKIRDYEGQFGEDDPKSVAIDALKGITK